MVARHEPALGRQFVKKGNEVTSIIFMAKFGTRSTIPSTQNFAR